MLGTLYGVGVGPGDPELMTLKADRILKEADVVAYPKKKQGAKSYAHQIVDSTIRELDKEMLGLVFPMTKDKAILERGWSKTVEKVHEKLAQGKDVAFVTEGDPFLYSTFIHMMKLMKTRYPDVEVKAVPGISSVNAAAARLGIPLAYGDDQVAIVPARDDYEAMKQVIQANDCVVFIKVGKVMGLMLSILRELDLMKQASVVTKVTADEEVIWNVDELDGEKMEYFTLMVVRK